MEYKAHIREETGEVQTVAQHAEGTARLCEDFAISELHDIARVIGLLHDVGKWQPSFQKRIDGGKLRVEHSGCGAVAAKELFDKPLSVLMEYCIAGHHSGLPDGGAVNDSPDMSTLGGRLKRDFEDYSPFRSELTIPPVDYKAFIDFLQRDCNRDPLILKDKFAFFTRYCFSCLVDADSIDTATFVNNREYHHPDADFSECLNNVARLLARFSPKTPLQKARAVIQEQVFDKVNEDSEIYLMNMPTGSGKTLCSMRFALERLIKTGKRRIIYIAPYNSIIDQTAEVFEELFSSCAMILRHQSSFSYEDEENLSEDYREAAKSASENWDAPIIITTMVQFFESLYANKRNKLRKLHNMGDSIIIFDEAHLMPQKYLQPCLQAVSYITRYLNSEAIFLTATMPDFAHLMKKYALPDTKILTLVEDESSFAAFKKCRCESLNERSGEELLDCAAQSPSSLIIVNKKSTALKLYAEAKGKKYHLSTYMTPCDRAKVIQNIRDDLKKLEEDFPGGAAVPEDRRITIISTSLIEAGVDIDVHRVFRELNGLDNILQSAGRCNREGKRNDGTTYIFTLDDESSKAYADPRMNLTKGLIEKYSDITDTSCIKEYYNRLYFMNEDQIEGKTIGSMFADFGSIPFKEYARSFEIISSPNESVVIPQGDRGRMAVKRIAETGAADIRRLQEHLCTVSPGELEQLKALHAVDDFGTGIWCLVNDSYYNEETGISFEARDYYC